MKLSKADRELISAGLWRFVRTFIPQIPAICAYLVGIKPEWAIFLSFIGAVATALDKMFRDLKMY
jgi:hypothetical protein